MLTERHVDDAEPEQLVTAEEWLVEHRASVAEDDRHRDVTEADVIEPREETAHDDVNAEHIELPERDVREVAADEPVPVAEDVVRIPSAAETAAATERADRAIAAIAARNIADAQEEAERRAAELNRWHADDQFGMDEPVDHDPTTVG